MTDTRVFYCRWKDLWKFEPRTGVVPELSTGLLQSLLFVQTLLVLNVTIGDKVIETSACLKML